MVTITGTGLTGATAVDFGTVAATNVTVVNATTITAVSPAGTGTVDVTVTAPNGTSAISTADQFTFAAVAPTVASLVRFGFHAQQTSLVLTFSTALNATSAQNVNNYHPSAHYDVAAESLVTAARDHPPTGSVSSGPLVFSPDSCRANRISRIARTARVFTSSEAI
jgi:hypothetical protein